VRLLRDLVAQNQQEISRADGKATVLLATTGTLLGLLLAVHRQRDQGDGWSAGLWWAGAAGAAAALFALLLAVLPRRAPGPPGSRSPDPGQQPSALAYFGDVVRAGGPDRLRVAVHRDLRRPETRLLLALDATSRIAEAKNRWVRRAVPLLAVALAVSFCALLPH
jgi:hypothetical protein